jgi:hypothetical protein
MTYNWKALASDLDRLPLILMICRGIPQSFQENIRIMPSWFTLQSPSCFSRRCVLHNLSIFYSSNLVKGVLSGKEYKNSGIKTVLGYISIKFNFDKFYQRGKFAG